MAAQSATASTLSALGFGRFWLVHVAHKFEPKTTGAPKLLTMRIGRIRLTAKMVVVDRSVARTGHV